MSLEENISYIDSVIQQIISDIFSFRKKRLECSSKILEHLKTLMDTTNLIYRLGQLYDNVIKVEHPTIGLSDIKRPRLKISYKGYEMFIKVNDQTVKVPGVPFFQYEEHRVEDIQPKISVETLRKNILIRLPTGTSVIQVPDSIDETGYYYFLDFDAVQEVQETWTVYQGKRLAISGLAIEISHINIWKRYNFYREITIGGTNYYFIVSVGVGKIIGYYYIASPNYIDDCEFPCSIFSFTSNYGGEYSYILFGRDFPRGISSNDHYYLDVLGVLMNGRYVLYNLTT